MVFVDKMSYFVAGSNSCNGFMHQKSKQGCRKSGNVEGKLSLWSGKVEGIKKS